MIIDSLWDVLLEIHMGEITEWLVDRAGSEYDLSRERQGRYALESHRRRPTPSRKASTIRDSACRDRGWDGRRGRWAAAGGEHGGPREIAARVSRPGIHPAANVSKLTDAATPILLSDAVEAAEDGFEPVASLGDYAVAYRPPAKFNEVVGDVIEKRLDRSGLAVTHRAPTGSTRRLPPNRST